MLELLSQHALLSHFFSWPAMHSFSDTGASAYVSQLFWRGRCAPGARAFDLRLWRCGSHGFSALAASWHDGILHRPATSDVRLKAVATG